MNNITFALSNNYLSCCDFCSQFIPECAFKIAQYARCAFTNNAADRNRSMDPEKKR